MKKLILAICFLFATNYGVAQDYKTHKVSNGESIEDIAKRYMVTPFDIFALNPDAKSGLEVNSVLIIPKSRLSKNPTAVEGKELDGFVKHKIRRKETLYSISKKYNVSIDEIKKHNKRLYSENLRKGDRIQIPKFKRVIITNTLENTIQTYKVLPKEGKWRIAYKFGITVDELEQLNPKMNETLQPGDEINVPNVADNEIKSVDENYGYYTVLPKEGFYRLKIKLGLDQDQLESLNPGLKESGLKSGMVLKVNKDIAINNELTDIAETSLLNNIKNLKTKHLAIMLPFRLNRIDLDSIREAKAIMTRDNYMSVSLDFHSGVLMALDSAKRLGISSKLDVYDTQSRLTEVSRILSNQDFSNYDAVIGPIVSENFERTAEILKRDNVPVFAGLSMPKKLSSNVYQTIPSDDYLKKLIINHVKSDSIPKHIIIIADSQHKSISDELKSEFPMAKQVFSRKNKKGEEANYILVADVEEEIKPGKNIIFLETKNNGFVSNVTSMLSAFIDEDNEIILMTTNKNRAFEGDNVSNIDLSNLKFHYPSVNKTYDVEVKNGFIKHYKRVYNSEPNKYAVRGFDLTMDILLRLASEDDLSDASDSDIETVYLENKFRYSKKLFGGYYNESAYIVKLDNLKVVEVKE